MNTITIIAAVLFVVIYLAYALIVFAVLAIDLKAPPTHVRLWRALTWPRYLFKDETNKDSVT